MFYKTHACVTWRIHVCVTWRIHTCDMTHSYVWHNSFTRVTWLVHMCNMTHSHVWHDSLPRVWRRMKQQRMLARRWRRTLIDYMHRFNLRRYHACHFSYDVLGLFPYASLRLFSYAWLGLFCSFAVLQPTQVSRMSLFILRIRSLLISVIRALFICVIRALLQRFNLRRYHACHFVYRVFVLYS